jgi:dGTP triphosphohydrolase
VKSGQPQSSAGKQALDEGLRPGTPEYQKRVSQIAELNVERQMGLINSQLANMGLQQANAALQQQKFGFQQEQAAKLTAPEMKLKTETEDLLAQTAQGYQNIKRALELNPKTFDTSLVDTAQRKALEAVGSKDPKVANTRELENLLEKAALSQLKATFPGAISNDERQALLATQGMAAKSIEERGRIMRNAADAMKAIYARNKKRLNDINQGAYRATQIPGDE